MKRLKLREKPSLGELNYLAYTRVEDYRNLKIGSRRLKVIDILFDDDQADFRINSR